MYKKYRAEDELKKKGLKTVDSFLVDLENYLDSRMMRIGNVKGINGLCQEIAEHLKFLNPTNQKVRRYFQSNKPSYVRLQALLTSLRDELAQVGTIFQLHNDIDDNNPRQQTHSDFIEEILPILTKLNGYNLHGQRQPGLIKKLEDLLVSMDDVQEL